MFQVNGVDYRTAYLIRGSECDLILVDRMMNFEDRFAKATDDVTGLAMRAGFFTDVRGLMENGRTFQVFLLGMSTLKSVSDVYGSVYADELMRDIVERLFFNVVSNYTLYRINTDTLALVREGRNEKRFVSELLSLFEESFAVSEKSVYVSLNVGSLAVEDSWTYSEEEILANTMSALSNAQSMGKGNWVAYTDRLRDHERMEMELENAIRDALKYDQFELYYQPQFSLKTNGIMGAEALIRWHHPEKGFMSPGVFIPIAEKSGLVIQIGEWVVREVCRQQREWIDRGLDPVRIGVNIGALHFKKPSFVEDVEDALHEYDIHPDLLGLEITESVMITDVEDMVEKLKRLRDMGIKVSIDDFGTGYSSFSYLTKFPIDTLKIDKSFVLNLTSVKENIAIVRAIVGLAQDLDIKVIAEGVETEEARDLLTSLNCHDMQGFLFSKPVARREFELHLVGRQMW